ncbi:MAG: hypothetical protein GX892_02385 [Thermoanaerobacteraceae bacterium]|nr:hypothetical protein [Thermoanaerobacteraceae bacterium]
MIKEELGNLYKLQEIQDRCDLLKQALKSHPELKHLYKLKKDANYMQVRLQEKNKRIHLMENELQQMEQTINYTYTTIKQVEERIYSGEVNTVKELKILEEKRDLAHLKVEEYEEKALEIMEELDNLKTGLPQEIKLINQKKTQYREKQLKINEEIGKIKAELALLQKQLQQLETSISSKLLEKFYKIKRFKRHPVALVSEGKCSECMMEVSVMIALEVERHESLIYCENCGRILV